MSFYSLNEYLCEDGFKVTKDRYNKISMFLD